MTENLCSLVANGLDLTSGPYETLGEDARFGDPQPLTTSMRGLLQDGSRVTVAGHDNRDMFFRVKLSAANGLELADLEAALVLATTGKFPLAWTPPDGWGPTTIFDVQHCELTFLFDDFAETRVERTYGLAMNALPFGRSVDEVLTSALVAGAGVDTQINAADSTTGWAAATGAGAGENGVSAITADTTQKVEGTASLRVTTASSSVARVDGSTYRYTHDSGVTLSGLSLNLSTTPYVQVSAWVAFSSTHRVRAYVDGVEIPMVASRARTGTWRTYYFYSVDPSVSALTFRVTQSAVVQTSDPYGAPPLPAEWKIRLDDVRRSGTIPTSSSTGRQSTREVAVDGSSRTVASLSVSHATTGLGDVLVYTSTALSRGGTPDLSQWRISGPTQVTGSDMISGKNTTFDATIAEVFEFPADPLPRGGYLLVGRLTSSGTNKRLTYTVATKVGSGLIGSKTYTSRVIQPTGVGYKFVTLGALILPPTDVPAGSSNLIQLSITDPTSASSATRRDELWILSMEDGAALSIINCGGTGAATLGTANSKLWLDTPSVDKPVPTAWLGAAADKSDAYHAGDAADSWSLHSFAPPTTRVFVANSGGANPEVALRYFPRWHTNAAQ